MKEQKHKERFYYKFPAEFPKDTRIKKFLRIAGKQAMWDYLQLTFWATNSDAILPIKGVEDSTMEEIALMLDIDEEEAEVLIEKLVKCHLLEIEGEVYYLPYLDELFSYKTPDAARKDRKREEDKNGQVQHYTSSVQTYNRKVVEAPETPVMIKEEEL